MLPLIIGGAMVGGGMLSNYLAGDPFKKTNNRLESFYQRVTNRPNPERGPAAQSANSDFRSNQADLIKRLEALSKGEGPSLATEQMRMATDRNMAQQASIAQSGRGNAALANIMAANGSARLGQQAAGDAVQARIAEQQMALRELGGNINSGRQSDETNSQFNAQQSNYRDKDNLEAILRARGMNDDAIMRVLESQAQIAGRPSMGDKLMGGGAGLLSFGATQQAQSNAGRR